MILEKVKSLLSQQFDVDEGSILPETKLVDDLGADSLDVVDLAEMTEDEFEIEISDEMIENIQTVGDIVNCISEQLDNSNVIFADQQTEGSDVPEAAEQSEGLDIPEVSNENFLNEFSTNLDIDQ